MTLRDLFRSLVRVRVLLLCVLSFIACSEGTGTDPSAEEEISPVAEAYLNEALDLMEAHSIRRYEIDWTSFRERAFENAAGAQIPEDTYAAIEAAVRGLADDHSFFLPPDTEPQASSPPSPSASLLDGAVGYVSVPWFSGPAKAADNLATYYHRLIEGVDTLGVCAWVVDLRGNRGGNMWPMLAGVGPVVGEGILGYFLDPDSLLNTWTYEAGNALLDGAVQSSASAPYELLSPGQPVAVLTDQVTASSGEAVAIAFQGRESTASFGRPTRGLSTANRTFTLSDGAILGITTSVMVDRTGEAYGDELEPDNFVVGEQTGDPETDVVLNEGIQWLRTLPVCGGS